MCYTVQINHTKVFLTRTKMKHMIFAYDRLDDRSAGTTHLVGIEASWYDNNINGDFTSHKYKQKNHTGFILKQTSLQNA